MPSAGFKFLKESASLLKLEQEPSKALSKNDGLIHRAVNTVDSLSQAYGRSRLLYHFVLIIYNIMSFFSTFQETF